MKTIIFYITSFFIMYLSICAMVKGQGFDSTCYEPYSHLPDSLLNDKLLIHKYKHNTNYKIFKEKETESAHYLAQFKEYGFPDGAKIIEHKKIIATRDLILWMQNPRVTICLNNDYTCPDITIGKGYYYGATFVSVLDNQTKRIIHTLPIVYDTNSMNEANSCFLIPFAIKNPRYDEWMRYKATGGTRNKSGKAEIMYLDDYNGDGNKYEFPLFQQLNCMACFTTLIGYSQKQDIVIQYEIEYELLYKDENEEDKSQMVKTNWIDHVFNHKIDKNGKLEFSIDYSGRGGSIEKYSLFYDQKTELFKGVCDTREVGQFGEQ